MRSDLTSVNRLLNAINGDTVDRVPNMLLIKQFCTRQTGRDYALYNRNYRELVECQLAIHERIRHDCFNVTGFPYREAADCGLRLRWSQDSSPQAEGILVANRADIHRITWPGPRQGHFMSDRLDAIRLFKERCPDTAVLGWVEGCFAQALTFRGMQNGMLDLIEDPGLIEELMKAILDLEIGFARAQIDAGADVIGIGDAAASLVNTPQYVEIILPFEHALVEAVQSDGTPAKLHICGNITHLLEHIATLNSRIVDIDWMVSLPEARRVLGEEVCLCGNIDPVSAVLQSDPDRIRAACRRSIREAGTPFVLSPGCEIPPDTPFENFAALCESYTP